jgi:hypothetical protein
MAAQQDAAPQNQVPQNSVPQNSVGRDAQGRDGEAPDAASPLEGYCQRRPSRENGVLVAATRARFRDCAE